MNLYKIWENQNWEYVYNDFRSDLLNNNFEVSTALDEHLRHISVVIHFGRNLRRKLNREEDYYACELLEEDGYNFLVKSIDELIELFHRTETGIDQSQFIGE